MENEKTSLIKPEWLIAVIVIICTGCLAAIITVGVFDTFEQRVLSLVALFLGCVTISWVFYLYCQLLYRTNKKQ